MRSAKWLLAAVALMTVQSCAQPSFKSAGAVTVQAAPAKTTTRYLDSSDLPQTSTFGNGLTSYSYDPNPTIKLEELPPENGRYRFKITHIDMHLSLNITVDLPRSVKDRLKKHEALHEEMCKKIYEKAPDIAMECATAMIGTILTEDANNAQAARQYAMRDARGKLSRAYLRRTGDQAIILGRILDRITNHGISDIPNDVAVKQTYSEYEKSSKQL